MKLSVVILLQRAAHPGRRNRAPGAWSGAARNRQGDHPGGRLLTGRIGRSRQRTGPRAAGRRGPSPRAESRQGGGAARRLRPRHRRLGPDPGRRPECRSRSTPSCSSRSSTAGRRRLRLAIHGRIGPPRRLLLAHAGQPLHHPLVQHDDQPEPDRRPEPATRCSAGSFLDRFELQEDRFGFEIESTPNWPMRCRIWWASPTTAGHTKRGRRSAGRTESEPSGAS